MHNRKGPNGLRHSLGVDPARRQGLAQAVHIHLPAAVRNGRFRDSEQLSARLEPIAIRRESRVAAASHNACRAI
jgi:hypothetical protein